MLRLTAAFTLTVLLLPALGLLSGTDFATYLIATTGPATFLFGVPIYFTFRSKGWFSWRHYFVAGLVGGLLCALTWVVLIGEPSGLIGAAPLMASLGGMHGIIFWAIAIYRNEGLTPRSTRTQP